MLNLISEKKLHFKLCFGFPFVSGMVCIDSCDWPRTSKASSFFFKYHRNLCDSKSFLVDLRWCSFIDLRFISYGFIQTPVLVSSSTSIICFPQVSKMMHSFSFEAFDLFDYVVDTPWRNDPSICLCNGVVMHCCIRSTMITRWEHRKILQYSPLLGRIIRLHACTKL